MYIYIYIYFYYISDRFLSINYSLQLGVITLYLVRIQVVEKWFQHVPTIGAECWYCMCIYIYIHIYIYILWSIIWYRPVLSMWVPSLNSDFIWYLIMVFPITKQPFGVYHTGLTLLYDWNHSGLPLQSTMRLRVLPSANQQKMASWNIPQGLATFHCWFVKIPYYQITIWLWLT